MLLNTDVPYLEPLLFHLRADESLKSYFTDKSFFMPHNHLVEATEEAMQKNCPAPRALWILPDDSIATSTQANCLSPSLHTFRIELLVQCIRNSFYLSKKDDEIVLSGQYMELATIRKAVKKSVFEFNKNFQKQNSAPKFKDVIWKKDYMLYPEDNNKFLATVLEYNVTIFQ